MKRHLIIAGTGRAGTSFLVRYLAECGLETHLSSGKQQWDEEANAGLEDVPVLGDSCPYVAKSPWLYEFVDDLLARSDIQLDGVIIPVRDLAQAAASRAILELRARHASVDWMDDLKTWETWGVTAGGTLYSLNPIDQARILAVGFHKVIQLLVRHDIKIALLDFPRLIQDPDYLYGKLAPLLPATLTREAAIAAHRKVADPAKVRVGAELAISTGDPPLEGTRKFVHPRVRYPEHAVVDNLAVKREMARLRSVAGGLESKLNAMTSARNNLAAALTAERQACVAERDALIATRDALTRERDAVIGERDALVGERDALVGERDALVGERDALVGERDQLVASRQAAIVERDALVGERNALVGERDILRGKLATVKRLVGWDLVPEPLRRLLTRALSGVR
jgi:hypothetical protein